MSDKPPQYLGKYELLGQFAAGGMAELHLARVTGPVGFEKIVALKRILPELAKTEEIVQLFLDEARLAATLQHSNVVQVYDVGVAAGSYFFTMEFVHGEDLRALLTRARHQRTTIPLDVAVSIIIGVCAGLHYAHEQVGNDGKPLGIIHRDVSPSNVLVSYDGLVKVADFGIAKAAVRKTKETRVGSVRGKYGYMSPEQCKSRQLDRRSDLFAIAILLWELTTSAKLYRGESDYEIMKQIVEEPPPRPSARVADYPAALERIVMKGLERDREARYRTAQEMQLALEEFAREEKLAVSPVTVARFMEGLFADKIEGWRAAQKGGRGLAEHLTATRRPPTPSRSSIEVDQEADTVGGTAPTVAERPRRGRGKMIAVGVVVAVLAAGAAGLAIGIARAPKGAKAGQARARRAVAVLGLKNSSGRPEAAWLSTAASEMLATELAAGEKVRIVPGEEVARMKIDLALPEADAYTPETLSRIRSHLGADLVLVGSYFALGQPGEAIRVDLRLQSTESGETIASFADQGTVAALPDLVGRTGARVREKMGLGVVSQTQAGAVRASLPADPEAARLYAEGLERLRKFDISVGRELFEKAVSAEPDHPMPHFGLAAAWSQLGYDGKAEQEAKRAFELSAHLSREERLGVEAMWRSTAKDWDPAIAIYRTLSTEFPDRLDYGARLASAQNDAGRPKEALETVARLRAPPARGAEEPRIDLVEAEAWDLLGDPAKQRAAAARAGERGRAREAWILVAQARGLEGWAERNLGQRKEAAEAFEEAKKHYERASDRGGQAKMLNRLAVLRYDEGDYQGAGELYEQGLAIGRQIGARKIMARILNNLALLRRDQGKMAESRRLFEEALALSQELRDKSNIAAVSYGLGDVLAMQGDMARGRKYIDESLVVGKELGHKRFIADAQCHLAKLLLAEGDLGGARRVGEEGLETARAIGDRSTEAAFQVGIGEALLAEGKLADARARLDGALALRTELGEKVVATQVRRDQAELALAEGRGADAERLLHEAIDELKRHDLADDEALAQGLLARALLARKAVDEARKAGERAEVLGKASERPSVRLSSVIEGARARAAAGERAEAARRLEAARSEAARLKLVGVELEAGLALGEIDPSPAGRARLVALVGEARERGFGGIVARAGRGAK